MNMAIEPQTFLWAGWPDLFLFLVQAFFAFKILEFFAQKICLVKPQSSK